MFLLRVTEAFEQAGVPYAVVGGYAVALHGAVRGTVDVDLVIRLKKADFQAAERVLLGLGLKSRLPVTAAEVFDFRDEYRKNRNLVAWSFFNPANPAELIDIILTHDLARLKTKKINVQKHVVHVLALNDLIRMKRASGRPQDLEDIKALEALRT
jgi:hypothetical protein